MKIVTHKFTNGTDGDFEVRGSNALTTIAHKKRDVLTINTKEELDILINLLTAVKQEIFKS